MGTYSRRTNPELPTKVFAYQSPTGYRIYDILSAIKSQRTRFINENKEYHNSSRAEPRVFEADVVWRDITDEL